MKLSHRLPVLLLAALAAGAAPAQVAEPAAETAGPPAGADEELPPAAVPARESRVQLYQVPSAPLDVLSRFFPLGEEQLKALAQARADYDADLAAACARAENQVNARFEARAAELLPGETEQQEFKRVSKQVQAYWQAMAEAESAYRAALCELGVAVPRTIQPAGLRLEQLVQRVPGLSDEERAAARSLALDLQAEYNRAVAAAFQQAAAPMPADENRDAWRQFHRDRARLRREVGERLRPQAVTKLAAALSAGHATVFEQLAAAAADYERTAAAAMDALTAGLRKTIGVDRMQPPPTGRVTWN